MFGETKGSIAEQQFDGLVVRLEYLEEHRTQQYLFAGIPVVGWGLWGMFGAWALGTSGGMMTIFLITVGVTVGLLIPQNIVRTLALCSAFLIAFAGPGYAMLFGGYLLNLWFTIALVFAGVRACWSVLNHDTEIARSRDRLEELAPKVGRVVPWKQPKQGLPDDELEVEPGWDQRKR